jgi:hypothetical protein
MIGYNAYHALYNLMKQSYPASAFALSPLHASANKPQKPPIVANNALLLILFLFSSILLLIPPHAI